MTHTTGGLRGWLRLGVALTLLAALVVWLTLGHVPPGVAGRVIRSNLSHDVQATALFYSDLEAMGDIEGRLDPK